MALIIYLHPPAAGAELTELAHKLTHLISSDDQAFPSTTNQALNAVLQEQKRQLIALAQNYRKFETYENCMHDMEQYIRYAKSRGVNYPIPPGLCEAPGM